MGSYEPTVARRRYIIEGKLRGLNEQRYSLELDARVNSRVGDAETVASIKKDLLKIEAALDLYMADLAELPADDEEPSNGRENMLELIK
jgi:hypothetical protein